MEYIMILKTRRHEYDITANDVFMDNGACVQLLSQSKEKSTWGKRPAPILSKMAVQQINKFRRVTREHGYGQFVQVFSLGVEEK